MTTLYWVGGSGTWDGTTSTNWSLTSGGAGGALVPTTSDDVVFDVNSNSGTSSFTVALSSSSAANCRNFNVTSIDGAMTIAQFAGATVNITGSITWTGAVSPTVFSSNILFNITSATTQSYNFNAGTLGGVTFGGVGSKTVTGSLACLGVITVTAGNLDLSGVSGTIGGKGFSAQLLSSSYTVTLGAQTINLSGAGAAWNMGSGLLSAGTSTINITDTSAPADQTFYGNNQVYYNVSILNASTNIYLFGLNTFNNLSLPGAFGNTLCSVYLSNSFTVSGTFIVANAGQYNRRTFLRPSDGDSNSQITITATTVSALYDIDFQNIAIAGASAPWSGTRLGNAGNNSGITFAAAKTVYWNSGATNASWYDSYWAATSGGTNSVNNFPLAQDTAIFDNTGLSTGGTVSFTSVYNVGYVNCSSRTNAMTFSNTQLNICGTGFVVSSSVTLSNSTGSQLYYIGVNTSQSLDLKNKIISYIKVSAPGSTVTLASAINGASSLPSSGLAGLLLSAGTFDTANYSVICYSFASSGTPTFNMGSSTITTGYADTFWTASATTSINAGSSTISIAPSSAATKTFNGGGLTYYNFTVGLNAVSDVTVNLTGANTFNNITASAINGAERNRFNFPASTITKVTNFNINGIDGSPFYDGHVWVYSSVSGTQATLQKPFGDWNIGANSQNISNNTGLTFSGTNPDWLRFKDINALIVPSSTNFFMIL